MEEIRFIKGKKDEKAFADLALYCFTDNVGWTSRIFPLLFGDKAWGVFNGNTLASAAGNSPCFRGGIVVNGDDTKIALGLEPAILTKGASRVTAAAIASLARVELNADIAIGLDRDPSLIGSVTLAQGTRLSKVFIAVDMGHGKRNVVQDYSWRPTQLVRRASQQALFTLRNLLLRGNS